MISPTTMNCSACCNEIAVGEEDYLCCSVQSCNKWYHLLCTGKKKPTHLAAKSWTCPECFCATKKGGDNSHTPVGVSMKRGEEQHVTIRDKKLVRVLSEEEEEMIGNLTCEAYELRCELSKTRKEIAHSNTLICSCETKLGHAIDLIADYDKKLNKCILIISGYENKLAQYSNIIATYESKLQDNVCQIEKLLNKLNMTGTTDRSVCLQSEVLVASGTNPAKVITPKKTVCSRAVPSQLQQSAVLMSSVSRAETSTISVACTQLKAKLAADTSKSKVVTEIPESRSTLQQIRPILEPSENANQSAAHKPNEWVEVTKKSRRPASICGTAGPLVTSLKAVDVRKYLHLWNMASGVEEVRDYLQHLCNGESCSVDELTAKGEYKSYKLGVPVAFYEVCFSTDVWPVNARIKPWINYRPKTSRSTDSSTSPRPFRSKPAARIVQSQ